jgi:Rrf2 family protein
MLRPSTKARYALRAMIELALRQGERPVHLHDVGRAQRLSVKYLEQLMIPLRRAGLVRGERGSGGGYRLARPAEEITALEVFSAVEGGFDLLARVVTPTVCERSPTCVARRLWMDAGRAMGEVLARASLADLRDGQRAADDPSPSCGGVAGAASAPTGAAPQSQADGARGRRRGTRS